MTDLRPCPFCGGEAELCNDEGLWQVRCSDCRASTDVFFMGENAINAWNTRYTEEENDEQN